MPIRVKLLTFDLINTRFDLVTRVNSEFINPEFVHIYCQFATFPPLSSPLGNFNLSVANSKLAVKER